VTSTGEEAKVAVRKHRHDVLGAARKKKDGISKDEMFRLEEELTKLTNAAVKQITDEQTRKIKDVTKD
jgi:ribosome recycling factor